jgi:hypothetical protein
VATQQVGALVVTGAGRRCARAQWAYAPPGRLTDTDAKALLDALSDLTRRDAELAAEVTEGFPARVRHALRRDRRGRDAGRARRGQIAVMAEGIGDRLADTRASGV